MTKGVKTSVSDLAWPDRVGPYAAMDRRSRSPLKKPEMKRRTLSITRRRRLSVDEGRQVTHARRIIDSSTSWRTLNERTKIEEKRDIFWETKEEEEGRKSDRFKNKRIKQKLDTYVDKNEGRGRRRRIKERKHEGRREKTWYICILTWEESKKTRMKR